MKPASGATQKRAQDAGSRQTRVLATLVAAIATVVAGCKSSPMPTPAPVADSGPTTTTPIKPGAAPVSAPYGPPPPSGARTPREYRKDAAGHLYQINGERIYKGRLPPLLYAIGTLEVEVDRRGNVTSTHWLRAPRHAPEVVKEIERTVRQAAPYPVPERLGKVTYIDTWLWHKSGKFQLDTLTEGQD
jgi:hypothetical protein